MNIQTEMTDSFALIKRAEKAINGNLHVLQELQQYGCDVVSVDIELGNLMEIQKVLHRVYLSARKAMSAH